MKINHLRYLFIVALFIPVWVAAQSSLFPIVTKTGNVSIIYDNKGTKLDSISAHLLAEDIERVTSVKPAVKTDIEKVRGNVIIIGSVQSVLIQKIAGKHIDIYKSLNRKWECFSLHVVDNPLAAISKALIIAGSDARGTAYGVFTLSQKIGVSPWYWWADAPVKKQKELSIRQDDYISTPPAVQYRGIFINDEDWGLQPWAAKTYEPETRDIGPKTYAKVFELLLRLKANLIWPAMHPSTKAFFHYPGNLTMAENYQIIIGSSHAEPMLRNNVSEWNEKAMGRFNYITNKEKVYSYWEDRVKESKGINGMYTIGMRGVHDSQMEGVQTAKEAVPLLERIIQEQRDMLSKNLAKDATAIPQVFTAYKEVLEVYDNGLRVPDDVMLVWPDDNYGYIQRLNNKKEQGRSGGAGVYYHASYWGRPHDYLWLPSVHPSLLREEMMKAYETGARQLWVLNVGDIKPQEFNMQQFLDIAFNPTPFTDSRYTRQYLENWVKDIFGKTQGNRIAEILWEYYRLAFERKPEFMGWSQTEPNTKTKLTAFNHFYYGDEAQRRIDRYHAIECAVKKLRAIISRDQADAFYQLVYYPVVAASAMNKKFLYRDKSYLYSMQNRLSAFEYAQLSKAAYDSIIAETEYYNTRVAGGKWKYIMSMNPRNLAVYQEPDLSPIIIDSSRGWGIAPEGFIKRDSSLVNGSAPFVLPQFDAIHRQQFFVDIFLSHKRPVNWSATTSHSWIKLSSDAGLITQETGKKQSRILITIDWNKLTGIGIQKGTIKFSGAGGNYLVEVNAWNPGEKTIKQYDGFVENNGYISMYASNFTKIVNKQSAWKLVKDIGYAGNVMQVSLSALTPDTIENSIKRNNPCLEYDFVNFSANRGVLHVFSLPTHPLNNNYSMRFAVSVDDGPVRVVDMRTIGRSEEWKQNVLRNQAEKIIQLPVLQKGTHKLRIYAIDPGFALDRLVVDFGGFKKAYGIIPETKTLRLLAGG